MVKKNTAAEKAEGISGKGGDEKSSMSTPDLVGKGRAEEVCVVGGVSLLDFISKANNSDTAVSELKSVCEWKTSMPR